jgi:hypothetical protein
MSFKTRFINISSKHHENFPAKIGHLLSLFNICIIFCNYLNAQVLSTSWKPLEFHHFHVVPRCALSAALSIENLKILLCFYKISWDFKSLNIKKNQNQIIGFHICEFFIHKFNQLRIWKKMIVLNEHRFFCLLLSPKWYTITRIWIEFILHWVL